MAKRPSIFDAFENLTKGFPFGRDIEDWFQEPFQEMIKRFEESAPLEFKEFVKEEKTPTGVVRRYGPFVYGFSYTAEPGKEPVFQEFGNIQALLSRHRALPWTRTPGGRHGREG